MYIRVRTMLCMIFWVSQNLRMPELVAHMTKGKTPSAVKKFTILAKKFIRNILLINTVLPVEYNIHTSVSKITKIIKFSNSEG